MKRVLLRAAAAAVLLALLLFGGNCGRKYYNEVYLPDKNIREANSAQLELLESVKPDVQAAAEPDVNLLYACEELNGDTAAWLTIPGTNIDYPVMQYTDNDFYLHNGADGRYNYELGCPFLDYRCEPRMQGFNSIVYGHNMVDDLMFSDITRFSDKQYFSGHKDGVLVLSDEVAPVRFFAYLSVESQSPVYHTVFITPSDRSDYIDLLFAEALYTDGFTKEQLKSAENVHFLLLSTCTLETESARGVLVGVF